MFSTNKRVTDTKLSNWELRFGAFQMSLLVGIMLACMMVSFYFGYYTGQGMGVELALNTKIADAPRFPVVPELAQSLPSSIDERAHARVSEQSFANFQAPVSETIKLPTELKQPVEQKQNVAIPTEKKIEEIKAIEPAVVVAKEVEAVTEPVKEEWMQELPTTTTKVSAATQKAVEAKKEVEQTIVEAIPTKKTIEPKAPSQISIASAPARGWYSQVAAKTNVGDAKDLANKLQVAGFKAMIEKANVSGRDFYRVLVGPSANKQSAEATQKRLKQNPSSKESFLRQVK